MQLSIATAQGDSTNLLAAWGLNWTPIDKTDPVEDPGLQRFFARYLSELGQGEFSNSLTEQRRAHLTNVNEFFGFLNGEQRKRVLDLFNRDYRERVAQYGQDPLSYGANMRDSLLAHLAEIQFQADSTQRERIVALVSENAELTFTEVRAEEEFTTRFAEEVKKQKQIFIEENWNRLVVQFKAGAKYNADEGTVNDFSILNYRIFGGLAGRVPGFGKGAAAKSNFAKNSQVVCQANYTSYRRWCFNFKLGVFYWRKIALRKSQQKIFG